VRLEPFDFARPTTVTDAQGTRAIFAAKYLPILGEFRAPQDEVRYYLQGIYIEPHESEGAYLVATDGHRFVVVHDETAQVDAPMLVNPSKLIVRESRHANLADFDGKCCDLQDDEEQFILRAPAPLVDGKFPDWRSIIPAGDITCEPGSIDPSLMAAISKAPFGDGAPKTACLYVREDKPCIVRFPSLPEIFVLVMPMRFPAMQSNPTWIRKRRKDVPPQQEGFELAGADVEAEDSDPVADNCPATA
jgi:DNA polymerase III beta subunit-like protein